MNSIRNKWLIVPAFGWCLALAGITGECSLSYGDIENFQDWTEIQDPPNGNLTAEVNSASQVTFHALGGPIPAGTDIGFASLNGYDVTTSTSGWYFDPTQDFSIAIDYSLTFDSASGGFSIGMGIGEDIAGTDSAGILLATQNGTPLSYAAAGRVDDADSGTTLLGLAAQDAARFIVDYTAATGTISLGVSLDGDDVTEGSVDFVGFQDQWDDEGILVSFFARGDNGIFNWSSGTADAVFSDFHVISGSPTAVPEPHSFAVLSLVTAGLISLRRKRS